MNKKFNLIFLMLIVLSLSAAPVFAQEEEAEITIAGIDICTIFSSILVIILAIALAIGFKVVKKLYGGRFTNALPYLLMAIALLFGMEVLCLLGDIYSPVGESLFFAHGIQMLQLVAGVFFISALYQLYQSRFATQGFMEVKE